MKRILMFLFLFFLFFTGLLYPQSPTDKGVYSISGGLSFSSTMYEDEDRNSNSFSLYPGFYFFLIPNFAIGGRFTYSNSSSGFYGSTSFGFGPGAKYYFDVGDTKLFILASFSYSSHKSKSANSASKTIKIEIGSGIDIFLSKNVTLEPFISYNIFKYVDSDLSGYKLFEMGIGIGVFLF